MDAEISSNYLLGLLHPDLTYDSNVFLALMHLISWGQTAKRKSLKTGCVVVVIMTYIVLDQTDHLLNIFALKYFVRVNNLCQESQKIVKNILLGYYDL